MENRAATLGRYRDAGWRVLGLSWQPEIAGGTRSAADARAVFARMQELLYLAIDVEYCPHAAGPPTCWCRKPLPGLGVLLIHRHQLDPAQCIYVGAGPQDPGFARKLGFAYQHADDFFSLPRGFALRTPLHAPSLAAPPARSAALAHSLPLVRSYAEVYATIGSATYADPASCIPALTMRPSSSEKRGSCRTAHVRLRCTCGKASEDSDVEGAGEAFRAGGSGAWLR